ncbi:site-specific integrase [Leeuwenhoekiella aequorea]|uniref:tyrosine-type recombinase/integrase n=1 Tax=Leeuwenhoekiella aequorea TaxID=283736 RepID=UPI00352C1C2F
MNQETMSILFYLNKSKINKKGLCSIKCRITYLKKRKEFSTGIFINPKMWDSKRQKVSQKEKNHLFIQSQLSFISEKLKKAFLSNQLTTNNISVENIMDLYLGKNPKKQENVVSYFKAHLELQKHLIDKDIKQVTWNKFNYVCSDVEAFIKKNYNKRDVPLEQLDLQFLNDFDYFLKTQKNQKQVTINKAIQRFRKPIKEAVSKGYLDRDPFLLYKAKTVRKQIVFLSSNELKVLEKFQFSQSRLEIVRDLFIFCCYTGLAYNEMVSLKKEHLVIGFDKKQWIQMKRQKTEKNISIPLLPKAGSIIEKYASNSNTDLILPKFSNQKINSYLKEIAEIVGINKVISHHTARKTFASTVLLYNDVPMEIVSELLGHSSIQITQQYYGKVVQKKVADAIGKLTMRNFKK